MGARILTLLEEHENLKQVVDSLELSGHHLQACKNFKDAIETLKGKNFEAVDLIISDEHLENGGNVFDFLKWVRRNPATEQIPFIMFSSRPTQRAKYLEDGMRVAARMLGTTKYITMNNYDSEEFRRQIDSVLLEAKENRDARVKDESE